MRIGWIVRQATVSLCLLLLAMAALVLPAELPARADPKLDKLVIETSGGARTFEVEVAATDAERAKGLMYRRYMPADRGMLFDFKAVEPVAMWMKNTLIPLDMVFIRANGSIARIAENTEPESTRTIASGEPVLAVLELNGGVAEKLGIKAGDQVKHPLFGKK